MLPPPTRGDRGAPTTSLPSTPLYPEEELVVYSSGGSQPSRILMRPLDKQAHRYASSFILLENIVRLSYIPILIKMTTLYLSHIFENKLFFLVFKT